MLNLLLPSSFTRRACRHFRFRSPMGSTTGRWLLYHHQIFIICSGLISTTSSERGANPSNFDITEIRLAHFSLREFLISRRVANVLPHFAFVEASDHAGLAQQCVSYFLKFENENSELNTLHGDASNTASILYSAPFTPYMKTGPKFLI